MDPGVAAVWAAGLGIGGTLLAGVGAPLLQAQGARRQARDQEARDVRQRLRDERRVAFAAVLDQTESVRQCLNAIIEARVSPDWRDEDDHRELWRPMNQALDALHRTATNVAITGPTRMGELAGAMHEAATLQAHAWRMPQWGHDQRAMRMAEADSALDAARREFVAGAQQAMAPPE